MHVNQINISNLVFHMPIPGETFRNRLENLIFFYKQNSIRSEYKGYLNLYTK